MISFRLLAEFQGLFDGKQYKHRDSSRGDWVAHHLYEDLYSLDRSRYFKARVDAREEVLNVQNKRRGVKARRGDGTFGELLPGIVPIVDPGFAVARGPIANVEVGVEVKILQKAMIKQIDRVMKDLRSQVDEFQRGAGNPICVGVVGINSADYTIGYEGEAIWRTNGRNHKHPVQEAAEAERRMRQEVGPKFDELIILRYKATNDAPYPFEWVNFMETFQDYGAALTRISRSYDTRFGGPG